MSEENKEVHICVLCNNKLDSKEALKDHFRKHANKEIDGKGRPVGPNGEAIIDVTTFRGRAYEKGSASKFVDGVISCDVCGEKFKCNTMAIQHKFRKHPHSISKYYCPQCGMQFPLKIHRDKHLAKHTPTSTRVTVTCNDCGEVFYNRTALEYHSKSTHQRVIAIYQPIRTPPPSKKIKYNNANEYQSVYYCHLCGFEYIVKFNLQKHLEKQHTQEERDNAPLDYLRCTLCDAYFFSHKAFENHKMYHKPDDMYVKTEQQRLQTVSRVDQDFDITRCLLGAEKYLLPNRCRRRKIHVQPKKPEKKKPRDDSSDEMSPPSPMDTSSDSESEIPLEKRMDRGKEENKNKKQVRTKKYESKKVAKRKQINLTEEKGKKVENSTELKLKTGPLSELTIKERDSSKEIPVKIELVMTDSEKDFDHMKEKEEKLTEVKVENEDSTDIKVGKEDLIDNK